MYDLRRKVNEEIDWSTRHWSTYLREYSRRAEPLSTYRSYVSDIYQPVQRLWRSASSSSLSSHRELQYDRGRLRRSSSYSSLAPSNAIPFRERSVDRYIPAFKPYTPKADHWRKEHSFYERSASFSKSLQRPPSRSSVSSRPSWSHSSLGYHTSPAYSPYSFSSSYRYKQPVEPTSISVGQRFTKPTSWGRLEYPYGYLSGQIRGLETASSFLYRNYELDDDRRMRRLYNNVQSLSAPHVLRKFQNSWYQYNPGRVLFVYRNGIRY